MELDFQDSNQNHLSFAKVDFLETIIDGIKLYN